MKNELAVSGDGSTSRPHHRASIVAIDRGCASSCEEFILAAREGRARRNKNGGYS